MVSRNEFRASQAELKQLLDRIEVALLVRDPGTALSADAYEGLRKTVASAARERRQHLVQLAEFADAIDRGATLETLRERVSEWCDQAGLVRVTDVDHLELFDITGEGDRIEIDSAAWVDPTGETAAIIKRGLAHRVASAIPSIDDRTDTTPDEEPAAPTSEGGDE